MQMILMCLPCSTDDLTPVHNLISFSDDINYWMSTNLLNRDKTEIFVVGLESQRQNFIFLH